MNAKRIAAILAASAAVLAVGSCGGAHALAGARARDFESACAETVGRGSADRLAPFEDYPVTEMEFGTELTVSWHYSVAGSVHCTLEMSGARVATARATRTNEYDRCSDPGAYPRRHWLCSAASAIVP